jgi:hypothetical protein
MASQLILQGFLLLHIVGIVLFIGTCVTDFVTHNQFWKQYKQDKIMAQAVLQVTAKFPMLMGIGFGIIILSGIGMMAITHGVFGEQLWFRIKFGLIVAIIILRLARRKQAIGFRKTLANNEDSNMLKMQIHKKSLTLFHYIQLTLLLAIIILSVFKFN